MDLKTARERAGISQAQLAELMGSSQTTLSFYESGRSRPTVLQHRVAEAVLNATIDFPQPRNVVSNEGESSQFQMAFDISKERIGETESLELFTYMAQKGPRMLQKLVDTLTPEDGIRDPHHNKE